MPRLAVLTDADGGVDEALVDAAPASDGELVAWVSSGGDPEQRWIHICATLKELAAVRRYGARTVWLNARAAAEQARNENEDTFLSDKITGDFADRVCSTWSQVPAALEEVLALGPLLEESEPQERGPVGAWAPASVAPQPELEAEAPPPAAAPASDTKFCMFCGVKLPRRARFCSECGERQE